MATRRHELTREAARLFAEKGYHGTSIGDLAQALGVQKASVYHHIESKQDLLWEEPRLRTPERFSCWTDVVSLVRNELLLARELAGAQRQPWESKRRDSTPEQVRRGMGRIIAEIGTPARSCQPRGYSPGWPQGRCRKLAKTYKVIFKGGRTTLKTGKPLSLGPEPAAIPT